MVWSMVPLDFNRIVTAITIITIIILDHEVP
jgi:hypothetical protein